MKGQLKKPKITSFKYDEIKFKNDPEYKNTILYTFAVIRSF
jgi:hypothetical protein